VKCYREGGAECGKRDVTSKIQDEYVLVGVEIEWTDDWFTMWAKNSNQMDKPFTFPALNISDSASM